MADGELGELRRVPRSPEEALWGMATGGDRGQGLAGGAVAGLSPAPADESVLAVVTDLEPLPAPTEDVALVTASAPTLTAYLGTITVSWDGLGSDGDPFDSDSQYVEVHGSTVSGFTPDASTLWGVLWGPGRLTRTGLTYGTPYYVRLVAKDSLGGEAAPTAQVSATPAVIVTTDLGTAIITEDQVTFSARDIGGITSSVGPVAPSSPLPADVWIDTANGNVVKRWSGAAWVAYQVGTLAIAPLAIDSTLLGANAVTTAKIADAAIATAKIAPLAIDSTLLAANAVTTAKIAADAVQAGQIAAGAVTTAKIAPLAIDATLLAGGAVTAGKIAADAVTAAEIAAGAVGSTEIAAGAVVAGKIAAGTIVAADIAAGTITGAKIAATTIAAENIVAGTITTAQIAADTITAGNIAANAITAAELAAGAVTAGKIAAGTIVAADIAAGTITGDRIAGTTITAANIAADTITASQIAANAITSNELAAGAVTAGKITAGTIVAADIAAGTITGAKIAGTTITAGNLVAGTITANEIAGGTITGSKIAANTIAAGNIVAGTITATEIAGSTITGAKIAAGTIAATNLAAGAVTAGKIATRTIDGFLITGGQFVGNGTNGEWIFKTRSGSYTVGNAGNVQRVEIGTNGSTQGMLGLYTGMQAHGGGEAENAPGALKAWWADDTGSYGYGSIGGVLVTELLSPAGKSSATAGITLMADGYTSFSKATIRASQTDIRGGPLQVVANDIFGGGVLVLSGGKVTLRDIREALYSPNDNYGRLYADTITQVLVGPGGTSGTQPTQGYLAVAFPAASGTANVNAYYANGNDGRYRWFFRAISSSLKAKNLLGDYTVDAEDFMALQPRRFTWKADEHEKVTGGFILEEVADLDTLMPFVNMSPTDPAVPASLDYGGMVAMLTDVVQRLIAKNDLTI